MIWAIKDKEKIKATPKEKAKCPICNSDVIAKCGRIKVWHWSHKSNKDCDNWYEPESEWHLDWKEEFPIEQQEFTMGKHRADIRTSNRWIIELQNSSISSNEIKEREEYYKRMIWLLNGKTIAKNLIIKKIKENNILTFLWKWYPKSWDDCKKEIYIDLGIYERKYKKEHLILLIKKVYENVSTRYFGSYDFQEIVEKRRPYSGYGKLITKEDFLKKFK